MLDRTRGGSSVAVGNVGVGMFGAFFFLAYYLQQMLGFSPIEADVAFLPLIAAVMTTATVSSQVLPPRTGPRPLVTVVMALAAAGMVLLTRLGVDSSYAAHVLPALVALGLIMAPAMNTGTLCVGADDSGVASAMVNAMQQIGGSLGTALLSTVSASATTTYLAGRPARQTYSARVSAGPAQRSPRDPRRRAGGDADA